MVPQTQARKPRNSSRVNLLISLSFHGLIVAVGIYFAARGGLLGKQIKKIAIEMVKEKPPEKPKEPEKPKVETPKPEVPKEAPKIAEAPKPEGPKETPVAPPPDSGTTVAPPATEMPSFTFEGGKDVQTSSDPTQLYRGSVEYALRSRWERPDNVDDRTFVAEVEVSIGQSGQISDPVWKKSSGDKRWDDSVRKAIAATPSLNRKPPKNFPPRVIVRFDVQQSEPVLAQ